MKSSGLKSGVFVALQYGLEPARDEAEAQIVTQVQPLKTEGSEEALQQA